MPLSVKNEWAPSCFFTSMMKQRLPLHSLIDILLWLSLIFFIVFMYIVQKFFVFVLVGWWVVLSFLRQKARQIVVQSRDKAMDITDCQYCCVKCVKDVQKMCIFLAHIYFRAHIWPIFISLQAGQLVLFSVISWRSK